MSADKGSVNSKHPICTTDDHSALPLDQVRFAARGIRNVLLKHELGQELPCMLPQIGRDEGDEAEID